MHCYPDRSALRHRRGGLVTRGFVARRAIPPGGRVLACRGPVDCPPNRAPRLREKAVEDLIARGLEDRGPDGRLELTRVVQLAEESIDVELVDGAAQERPGRQGAVNG